jgi:hypothetical protein
VLAATKRHRVTITQTVTAIVVLRLDILCIGVLRTVDGIYQSQEKPLGWVVPPTLQGTTT